MSDDKEIPDISKLNINSNENIATVFSTNVEMKYFLYPLESYLIH